MKKGILLLLAGFAAGIALCFVLANHLPEEDEDRNDSCGFF